LVPSDNTGTSQFGVSVSLSSDGNKALIGGYSDNSYAGAAWVFKRSTIDSTWTQYGNKLVGTDTSGKSRQGFGVALSGDGSTALVGGYADSSFNGAAWVFVDPGVLPVEVSSFSAAARATRVGLRWETASETNNSGFEVSRSVDSTGGAGLNPAEGAGWTSIAFVHGAGSSSSTHRYSYEDIVPGGGVYSYRLREIDRNGTSGNPRFVTVKVENEPRVFSLAQNYPNPFNPTTTIRYQLAEPGPVRLGIVDALGRELAVVVSGQQQAGAYTVQWNALTVPSGVYFYRLQSGTRVLVRKLMVVK